MLEDELERITEFDENFAKEDAKQFISTLADTPSFYSGQHGDYMSSEELETLERGKVLPGNVPDFTRQPIEPTAEELEDARKWAQSLP